MWLCWKVLMPLAFLNILITWLCAYVLGKNMNEKDYKLVLKKIILNKIGIFSNKS